MWRSPVLVLVVLLPSLAAAAAGITTTGETRTRRQRGLSSSQQGFRGLADRSTRNDDDDDEPSLKSPPKKSETKKKKEEKGEPEPEPDVPTATSITTTTTTSGPPPSPALKAKPTGGAVMTYVESHESVVADDLEGLEEKVQHSSGESRIVTIFGFVLLVLGCGFGYKYYQDRQSANGPVYTTIP
jgi:hypothetical protein